MTIDDLVNKWPRKNGTAIQYAESINGPASPEEEFRDDGSRAIRTLYCRWEERFEFRDALLGYPSVFKGPDGRYISRANPDYHPECLNPDGKPYLFATQIMRCEPHGFPDQEANGRRKMRNTTTNVARYGLAKLQVLYETLPWEILDDDRMPRDANGNPDEATLYRNVVVMPTSAAQGITIPTNSMKWVDGASPANAVTVYVSKLEITTDVIIRWMRVPREAIGIRALGLTHPSYPIDNAMGKMNSITFAGAPPGTLLMEAAIPTPVRSAVGLRLFDVEFRLKFFNPSDPNALPAGQQVTHTHLFRKLVGVAGDTGKYVEATFKSDGPPVTTNLTNKDAGKSLYDWADFNLCFRVPR